MASSLEDLLAEDGFKGRKSLMRSKTSFREESPTLPPFPFPDRLKKDFMPNDTIRTVRSSRHATQGQSPIRGSTTRPRDGHVTREKTKMDSWCPTQQVIREKKGTGKTCEIVEVEEEENERVKDIYSNEVYSLDSGKDKHNPNGVLERDKSQGNSSKRSHAVVGLGRRSYSDNNRIRKMKQQQQQHQHQQLGNSEKVSSNGKTFEAVSEPALDEAAIQAMVSILSGHIKRFLRDKEFRETLRHNCLSSLIAIEAKGDKDHGRSKILAKLEDAIAAIEEEIESTSARDDLKRAVLQLRVIVGLNSNDSKDGFTSGIPNHKLSACAHLYLSVVYKLQRKDNVAAKHLLQVFCDSPFLARTTLLSELWDCLFLPNLSHLNAWYDREANSLTKKPRKLELLAKVYNEIMDSGTVRFAVYYKDWLVEGVETAPVPSILVPSVSEMFSSPNEPFSPQLQLMVSEKLYNDVFRNSSKSGSEDGRDLEDSDNCVRACDGDALVKDTLTYSCGSVKEIDQDVEPDQAFFPNYEQYLESPGKKWTTTERDHRVNENFVESETSQEKSENTHMINSQPHPHAKENELAIKGQAKSHFDLLPPESELTNGRPSYADLLGLYLEERSPSFSSIPQEFICPLTGQLFEEPVTLETGQTFERKAIKAWFDQGNTTCPATAKNLECKQLVPSTNLVLKRIIETWKSQNFPYRALDHRRIMTNAGEFVSLGGLELLLQRFGSGNLEERTCVASLLVCCVESDSRCRNKIAKEIDRKCLIELLLSKQIKARESAVLLLVELICLKRKKEVIELLSGLKSEEEGVEKTMHVVLVYLQSSPPPQKPLVAVLLLHFDLLVEPRKYSIYREEAVDAITEALCGGFNNDKIRENCRRALLILRGQFSSSGKLLTHNLILNQVGFKSIAVANSPANKEEEEDDGDSLFDEASSLEDEEDSNIEQWRRNLCASILGNGRKRSFLEAISKCIASKNIDLATACLATVEWLSAALCSMPDTELQLHAFSALISRLTECLQNGQRLDHKVFASASLLNFSKISECRVLLMSMAENITCPLSSLVEVTWTAKRLYTIISGEAF